MSTEKFNLLFRDYPEEMQLSKSRRAIHIHESEGDGIPANIRKSIGASAVNKYFFDPDGWVISRETSEKVIRNKRTAGKPKMLRINGQSIWDGSIDRYARNNLKVFLTHYFTPIIIRSNIEKLYTPKDHYFHFEFIFYFPLTLRNFVAQDIDNHAFCYVKAFLDTMQELKIIENDNPLFARGYSSRYVDIPTEEDRRLEVKIHFCKNNERIS